MTNSNEYKTIKTCADYASVVAFIIFLVIPWAFYYSALKGPRDFGTAISSIIPVFLYDAIPFCAGLIWLVYRYGGYVDQKMPRILRTSWIAILLFFAILGPVFLIKLSWK